MLAGLDLISKKEYENLEKLLISIVYGAPTRIPTFWY